MGIFRLANETFNKQKAIWITRGLNQFALHDRRAAPLFAEALSAANGAGAGRSIALQAKDGERSSRFASHSRAAGCHRRFRRFSLYCSSDNSSRQGRSCAPPSARVVRFCSSRSGYRCRYCAAGHSLHTIALKRKCSQETLGLTKEN